MAKCLIIDSSAVIRMMLSKIMEVFGYEAIEEDNGEEGLRIFEHEQPDVVIMDWFLPMIEGIDLLRMIRGKRDIKQPAVLFCSVMSDPDTMRLALDAGADDFIIKPFDEDILRTKFAILGLIGSGAAR
jgi:two-component system chemotaxis response regulator CheY